MITEAIISNLVMHLLLPKLIHVWEHKLSTFLPIDF